MKRGVLKWIFAILIILGSAMAGLIFWGQQNVTSRLKRVYEVPPVALSLNLAEADVVAGRHLVQIRHGCADCHGVDLSGNMVMDNSAMGTIAGPNITPAMLKNWSDGEVARAIRHGIGKNGQALVLMPSHDYMYLAEPDVVNIIAYLRSIPPIEKPSLEIKLGPVAKIMIATGKAPSFLAAEIIEHRASFPEKPKEKVSIEFGQYLTRTTCMGCHGRTLKGGAIPGGAPDWPPASDLTSAAIGSWQESDFIKALRSGINFQGKQIRPPMPIHLTSQMTDTELMAIWKYIKSL